MAEGVRLESVCAACRTAGSNPALSAEFFAEFRRFSDLRVLRKRHFRMLGDDCLILGLIAVKA